SDTAPAAHAMLWPKTCALLLIASAGVAAVWVLAADRLATQSSWMAVIAAVDAAWLLHLCRVRAGTSRALAGTLATALAIALANWGIAAVQVGRPMGLVPWEAVLRLGGHHAWTLLGLVNSAV